MSRFFGYGAIALIIYGVLSSIANPEPSAMDKWRKEQTINAQELQHKMLKDSEGK